VLLVSTNSFNGSRIHTVIVAAITSNLRLGDPLGNVRLPARTAGLPKASVVNVAHLLSVDKSFCTERLGRMPPRALAEVDNGLRAVFSPPGGS
jgi:mRNA interferase MazF